MGALCGVMLRLVLGGGSTLSEWIIAAGFLLTTPYVVIGFWNAVIGLWLLHVRPGTVRAMPGVAELEGPVPRPDCRVALVMTLHNEAPAPIFARMARMRRSIEAASQLQTFTFVYLSDSSEPEIVDAETRCFATFCGQRGADEALPRYRRRTSNRGYKAGNIYEFLEAHGEPYRYFVPLDSDSLIAAGVLLRMISAMENAPRLGILQSLVVGMPSRSAFTRIFQFGMRHGMRVFTAGAAWWTADCGSYWGHNAVIRTAAFIHACKLPTLRGRPPFGGAILSHDQVEAAFMRRAGYEVRTIPVESESYEINPPTLLDFIRRELRWCQGNMQYFHLLATPRLRLASRAQLSIAIGMYLGQAAWIAMIAAASIGSMVGNFHFRDFALGMVLFVAVFALSVTPKLCGALDVCLTRGGLHRYGGAFRFALAVLLELLASMLMAPVVALSVTLFLIGLVFGRRIAWGGQNRDRLNIAWRKAAAVMAPHTLFGIALGAALWSMGGWHAVAWGLPLVAGLALAIPGTVVSARPWLGHLLAQIGMFAIPEERTKPDILAPDETPAAPPRNAGGQPAPIVCPSTTPDAARSRSAPREDVRYRVRRSTPAPQPGTSVARSRSGSETLR